MVSHSFSCHRVVWIQFVIAVLCLSTPVDLLSQDLTDQTVDQTRLPTGRLIQPAGQTLTFHGRPVDLEADPNSKLLFVKDRHHLRVIDRQTLKLVDSIQSPGGASLYGMAIAKDGRVYFTNAANLLHVFTVQEEHESPDKAARYVQQRSISLPNDSFPCGVVLSEDGGTAYVCLSKKNQLAIVDLQTDQVTHQIDVGVAPFDVVLDRRHQRLFISNIGGRRPRQGDATAPSAGTETVVDQRGIASTGTVSVIDLKTLQVVREIPVGLHPSVMTSDSEDGHVWVTNTNQDSITRINADLKTDPQLIIKPEKGLPFGSMPSALSMSPNRKQLFIALAGNNAVAVVSLEPSDSFRVLGFIPTAWYPAALDCDDEALFVANIKGTGARSPRREAAKGRNSHDHQGLVQRIPYQKIADSEQLARWTDQVKKNSRIPQILRTMEMASTSGGEDVAPRPIPLKRGQPSRFRHVIYVIKENRTFDQVFGDLKEARSDPSLCVFPEEVTPNHHALAKRFGILDNYYCNGVLSADGHSWATEGNVTPYLERAFGGFARSYTFGDDPITYSSSGFLWDHILAAGLSFRNYGELDYATPPDGIKYQAIWKKYQAGEALQFEQNIGIQRLRRYSCRDYPGWNMQIPDVLRMDRFLKEFREFEKNGDLPHLCIVYLPQDHLGGGVTSRAHMADNDLALGRLVEAVSHSKYWQDTVIFVNEDDPQNGFDHIDGHRSICLVISAYSRPGVNHQFYNQTSVLRTILHLFGLPPMNQQDASAPLMSECFVAEANLEPYKALDANFPLNEAPKPPSQMSATERQWRKILATVPIERTGMKSTRDEDHLNRFIWHEMKGWDTPYPEQFAGAHGRGLKQIGLQRASEKQP